MTTSSKNTPTKLQSGMQTLADALSSSTLTLLTSMIVLGSTLSKAEVIIKLRAYIALCAAVLQAKQAYVAAVAARKSGEAAARAFYEAVIADVKQAIGPNNPTLLAAFGIAPPKQRKAPTVEAKTIAKAKAAATREARGTMSKKQRSSITTGLQPQVQVIGLGGSSQTSVSGSPAPSQSTPSAAPVSSPLVPATSPSVPTTPATPHSS